MADGARRARSPRTVQTARSDHGTPTSGVSRDERRGHDQGQPYIILRTVPDSRLNSSRPACGRALLSSDSWTNGATQGGVAAPGGNLGPPSLYVAHAGSHPSEPEAPVERRTNVSSRLERRERIDPCVPPTTRVPATLIARSSFGSNACVTQPGGCGRSGWIRPQVSDLLPKRALPTSPISGRPHRPPFGLVTTDLMAKPGSARVHPLFCEHDEISRGDSYHSGNTTSAHRRWGTTVDSIVPPRRSPDGCQRPGRFDASTSKD
jgi:hypothetical protein